MPKLGFAWFATRSQTKRVANTHARIVAHVDHALGQLAASLDKGCIVQERKGMKRRVRERRPHSANLPAGVVEKHGRPSRAAPKRVYATTVQVVAVALLIRNLAEAEIFPHARRLIGHYAGTAQLFDEQAA